MLTFPVIDNKSGLFSTLNSHIISYMGPMKLSVILLCASHQSSALYLNEGKREDEDFRILRCGALNIHFEIKAFGIFGQGWCWNNVRVEEFHSTELFSLFLRW